MASRPAVLFVIFLLICFGSPLAQETGHEQATHPAAAQDAATYQESQEPAILAAPFLLILVILALALVLVLTPLTQETGQEQATQPAAAQDTSSHEESQEPAILAAPFLLILVFVLVLILTLTPLVQEMSQEQVTHPAPTQHPTAD